MTDRNEQVFIELFRETCQKCFGHPLETPLSETDSKLLSNAILEQTGLVIGVKSIKNYSQYVLNPDESKKENPGTATLDTFARYVLNAPETNEIKRKGQESHHPYWFQYRSKFTSGKPAAQQKIEWKKAVVGIVTFIILFALLYLLSNLYHGKKDIYFTDEFANVSADSVSNKGWIVKNEAPLFWSKRDSLPNHLSLYTLPGDNWPAGKQLPGGIKNLLIRKLDADCFSAEIHLTDFIPQQSWQQAGIILAEDSTFSGKAIRLSLGYNNFFGGYSKPAEIIIQAVASTVDGSISRPEEIAHVVLFSGEPLSDSLIVNNLSKSALKIEKKANHFRFLYTNGRMESFAFREAAHGDFAIEPKYIGIFAMQGFAATEHPLPVKFDSFSLIGLDCKE